MSTNTAEKQEIEQEAMTEIEVTDDADFQVDIVDDTPEEDRNRPVRADKKDTEEQDDEVSGYGEGVQKRIKQLKYEYHEERRAKEEAARQTEEAIKYAQRIQEENKNLKKLVDDGENTLVKQAQGRIEAQLDGAKREYKEAFETGDPDKIVDAQSKLTKLETERIRVDSYTPKKRSEQEIEPPVQRPQQAQEQGKVEIDARTKQWADSNEWFGSDDEMTGFAFGVHAKLEKAGIDPKNPTRVEEYYESIDRAMRKRFPDKFEGEEVEEAQPRQTGNVVAPANRSAKKPRRVQLTSSQVSIAKRLGLTPEQYAAQLLKEAYNV